MRPDSTGFAFGAGLQLGLLQFACVLAAESALSSMFTTLGAVLSAWLVGSLVGLWAPVPPAAWLAAACASHVALHLALGRWTPPLALFLAVSAAGGGWAGAYFQRALGAPVPSSRILSAENTGFALGGLGAFVGFV
ncbi:MAG: hypothetical protein EOO75_13755, partial [Myxococcales bacterium]